jgi:hypothetical protein
VTWGERYSERHLASPEVSMTAHPTAVRLVASLAAAVSLAACGGTVDFSFEKDLVVDSNVPAGTLVQPVDLAAEAGGAWKHRNKIDKVTVTSAEALVQSVSLSNVATTFSGDVWLLPEGVTTPDPAQGAVLAGSYQDEPVTPGNVIGLLLTPELNAFVRNAFNGSGRFSVYASGTGAGGDRVACTLHVTFGAKLKWKLI